MNTKLEIKNLKKEYCRNDVSFLAVNDVSLKINKGDFACITGHSGCGKSTLINLIAGLLTPSSGDILISGNSIINLNDKKISEYRNKKIGYILQDKSLLSNLTVLENIKLPFSLSEKNKEKEQYINELLSIMKIEHLKNSYPSLLSGGEAKRVEIIRALINNPDILLADEPTSNLDFENTKEIMELFKNISKNGTSILMVTHNLELKKYCNKQYNMEDGILKKIL